MQTNNIEKQQKNNTKVSVRIKGMHCASCASIIEKTITKDPAVKTVSVNFATEKVSIEFDDTLTSVSKLSESLKPLGYGFVEEKNNMNHDMSEMGHDMSKMTNYENDAQIDSLRKKVYISLSLAFVSVFIML